MISKIPRITAQIAIRVSRVSAVSPGIMKVTIAGSEAHQSADKQRRHQNGSPARRSP